ncbi:peptidoglycan peptidase [Pseudoroseicyclus tamaricis]|nr:peptidoglycan peptidase [Pseudoroseicyclus tamaricis]
MTGLAALCLGAALPAQDVAPTDWAAIMAEAAWDWHPGDLVFRNGWLPADDWLKEATGGTWASVGILRSSSGGPRVIYVSPERGVTEDMLDDFIAGLGPDEYEAYRLTGLDPNAPGRQVEQGPLPSYALFEVYGAPFDTDLTLGNGRFYGAELAFEAAQSAGSRLGEPVRLGDLAEVDAGLLASLPGLPYCAAGPPEACWQAMRERQVVTPDSLIASGMLTRMYPE